MTNRVVIFISIITLVALLIFLSVDTPRQVPVYWMYIAVGEGLLIAGYLIFLLGLNSQL